MSHYSDNLTFSGIVEHWLFVQPIRIAHFESDLLQPQLSSLYLTSDIPPCKVNLSVTISSTLGYPHTQDTIPPNRIGLRELMYVDLSFFNGPVKWIKWSLNHVLTREFAEEIHNFREYCKYRHVHQANP